MCTFHVRQRRQRGWMVVAEKLCQHPVRCSVGNACCTAAGSVVSILVPQGASRKHVFVSAHACAAWLCTMSMIMVCPRDTIRTSTRTQVNMSRFPAYAPAVLVHRRFRKGKTRAFAVALRYMHNRARTHSQGFYSSLPLQCPPLCRARTSR